MKFIKFCFVFVIVLIGYFLLSVFGLKMATINSIASPIWLASGFSISMIYLFGKCHLLAIFLGAILPGIIKGDPLLLWLGIGLSSTSEAFLGAFLINKIQRSKFGKNYNEIIALFFASFCGGLSSALIGVSSLVLVGFLSFDQFFYNFYTWCMGNLVGSLVLIPVFTEFKTLGKKIFFSQTLKSTLLFLLLILSASILVFLSFRYQLNQAWLWTFSFVLYICSFYLEKFLLKIVVLAISFISIGMTLTGYSLFEFGEINISYLNLQMLIISWALASQNFRTISPGSQKNPNLLKFMFLPFLSFFIISYFISDKEKNDLIALKQNLESSLLKAIKDLEVSTKNILKLNSFFFFDEKAILLWKPNVRQLDYSDNFRYVRGFGVIQKIDSKFKGAKIISAEYARDFNNQYIITNIEPVENNLAAVNLDIGSEKNRREAAELSANTGKVVATKPIVLVQDELKRMGFLVLSPVYQKNAKTHNLSTLLGWTYSPVIASVLFEVALNSQLNLLHIKIDQEKNNIYNYNYDDKKINIKSSFFVKKDFDLFGVSYTLQMYPSRLFFQGVSFYSSAILFLIILVLFAFLAIYSEMILFVTSLNRLVNEKSNELTKNQEKLIYNEKMASLGELSAGIAHEINNPLAIISGRAEQIKLELEKKLENPNYDGLLKKTKDIQETTERISKIIKGLLLFSRRSDGEKLEKVNLNEIINDSLALCHEKFKHGGVGLDFQLTEEIFINCNRTQIMQVLLNLLTNSFDAVQILEEKWIRISTKTKKNKVVISIQDSGKGINQKILNKIMEPFFTTKEIGKGTGLGLSLSKGIIENHKGTLYCDNSQENTTFIIILPIAV